MGSGCLFQRIRANLGQITLISSYLFVVAILLEYVKWCTIEKWNEIRFKKSDICMNCFCIFFIAKAWNNILRVKKSVPFRKSPKYVSKYEWFGRRQGICSSDSNFFQRKSRNNQGTYQQQKLLRNRPNSCQMVVVRYISKASKDSCWLFENAVGKICSTEKTEKTREISNKQ